MENKLELINKDLLDAIDKCNSDEDLFELEFCKKDSNEIEKIIADIFSDLKEIHKNNKKMCLDLNQIIKLLKICKHKDIKISDRYMSIDYEDVLTNVIVQNDRTEVLFSDFMLLIHFLGCEDHYAYLMGEECANFIIQNIKQRFLNAVKEKNNSNIISTENKILYDDNGDKLTPDEMMLIRSKTFMKSRSDIDKWIWQQFVDSNWDLEQVFNFFKLNGNLYPMKPVTHFCFNNKELLDIDYIFISELYFSKELVNAIKKKMDLYTEQILSDEKTDDLTLEEIKVIAISNCNFNQNHELKEKFLNRIPKQIDLCYFRYFVSIFVEKELAKQNIIDQEFINSYMARVKTNSTYEKDALNKIKKAKRDFEFWTPKATNLRIEENWERFKTEEYSLLCTCILSSIADDLKCKLKSRTLDPDLADKIISEMPNFKNKDSESYFNQISNLINAKRANKNLIDSAIDSDEDETEIDRIKIINENIKLECARDNTNLTNGKNNTGRPWYVILGHILTLGIFLWGPLLLNCMFECCGGEPEEPNTKKIDTPTINSNTHNNQSNTVSTTVSTIDMIIQSSEKPGMNVGSDQLTKSMKIENK